MKTYFLLPDMYKFFIYIYSFFFFFNKRKILFKNNINRYNH